MGGPVAEDSGRDNRRAVNQVQARQRQAEANRLPGTLGSIQGAMGDMNRRNITRGLELGGEAVRDNRGQVVGVVNRNRMGGRVYSGRAGFDPFDLSDTKRRDDRPSERPAATASAATAPVAPPVAPPPAAAPVDPSPAGDTSGGNAASQAAAPAVDPVQPRAVVRSAAQTAAVTSGRASPYRRRRRTRSILTSSRGVLGDAPTQKKQLLGS